MTHVVTLQWASGWYTCLSGFFTCHGGCCTYFGEHYICFAGCYTCLNGWYTVYREIFSHFIFAPFLFAVSGQVLDWVNSNVSNYFSFNNREFKMGQNCLQLQKNFLKNHMEWKQPCIYTPVLVGAIPVLVDALPFLMDVIYVLVYVTPALVDASPVLRMHYLSWWMLYQC